LLVRLSAEQHGVLLGDRLADQRRKVLEQVRADPGFGRFHHPVERHEKERRQFPHRAPRATRDLLTRAGAEGNARRR
jgi:hypothetical protein